MRLTTTTRAESWTLRGWGWRAVRLTLVFVFLVLSLTTEGYVGFDVPLWAELLGSIFSTLCWWYAIWEIQLRWLRWSRRRRIALDMQIREHFGDWAHIYNASKAMRVRWSRLDAAIRRLEKAGLVEAKGGELKPGEGFTRRSYRWKP